MAVDPGLLRTPPGNGPQTPDEALAMLNRECRPSGHGLCVDNMASGRFALPLNALPGYIGQAPTLNPHTYSADHTLRRKTPTGTFNAGFQSSLHPHTPMKQLMMATNAVPAARTLSLPYHNYDSFMTQNQPYTLQYVNPLAQGGPTYLRPYGRAIGPTASGIDGSGSYGPYWHDGTFVPYRPHALREPRYYMQPSEQLHGLCVRPHHQRPYSTLTPDPFMTNPQRIFGQCASPHDAVVFPRANPCTPTQASEVVRTTPLPFAERLSDLHASSATAQDRERIFAMALQTYRELLAFLEKVRRSNEHQKHGQSNPRPGIYPKPPSSSTGQSPIVTPATEQTASLGSQSDVLSDLQPSDRHVPGDAVPMDRAPAGLGIQPSACIPGEVTNLAERLATPSHREDQEYNRAKPTQMPSSSFFASAAMQNACYNTIVPRATNALASLEQLCSHTAWQWIDGLNLSGCLAYGLGLHQQALQFYNRVLNLDPKHIEATANLAATLLALGRKSDAEQLWVKAVRQAPSYFEAVEHLVGLLCSSGRAKDAVKVIDYVERSLRMHHRDHQPCDLLSDASSPASRSPCVSDVSDKILFDHDLDKDELFIPRPRTDSAATEPGFGSSGFSIPGADNGRILALVHAKGNMMYSQGDNAGAARAFEEVVLIAAGRKYKNVRELVRHVLRIICTSSKSTKPSLSTADSNEPILLHPEQAVQISRLCFPPHGDMPGLAWLATDRSDIARKNAILTTSNSLLSLAKIFQDGMATTSNKSQVSPIISGVREILALYYVSLSLQPSPSTANNVGILLAGVQHAVSSAKQSERSSTIAGKIPGVVPGSGIALALAYYNYGLVLDSKHAHLYTNLGSLLKDIGQLDAAIEMYKRAVHYDPKFDIALANLANAVKDEGKISEAIEYYHRAVEVNPDFAEAVCGLANALNSVCRWKGRGGIVPGSGSYDRWHVDNNGLPVDPTQPGSASSGWIKRVVDIVEKQLRDGEDWGCGSLTSAVIDQLARQILDLEEEPPSSSAGVNAVSATLALWSGQKFEGARLVRLVERITRKLSWRWYRDRYISKVSREPSNFARPQLPATMTVPPAPTVLPFHTFTSPLSAQQVRMISQRNGYRISMTALKSAWLGSTVFPPPPPPSPALKIGYVSSDFNNHPLAHLMQSVFGLHDPHRLEAYCYATTASDKSVHRRQIESEAPHFRDASNWPTEKLVREIISDGIHILVNLNGYTRGARNEVFAARPAPIQMSFMGFAGTLGAEWSDYIYADHTSIPPSTLRPNRENVSIYDHIQDDSSPAIASNVDWVYGEKIIFSRSTFFCCDHRQSAPDSHAQPLPWSSELSSRLALRKQLFPALPPQTVIFANFNQLYKIDPSTFRSWLRILSRCPNAILWLLRFPDLGEANLLRTANLWAGAEVASRVVFTDVAPKNHHIARAKVVDLFLDTPECNAHTTAADVLWSGTPLLTWPRYEYKMCSRMAASILRGAIPEDREEEVAKELIASSEEDYESKAVSLCRGLRYPTREGITAGEKEGEGQGRLMELRQMLTQARWTSRLFDTRRWVGELEDACEEAWRRWVKGVGGDIEMKDLPLGRHSPLP